MAQEYARRCDDGVVDRGSRLDGGNTGGAVRLGDTVRLATGPWTPAVHSLLDHLQNTGFDRAPQALGWLRLFLDSYGWGSQLADFVSTVQARVTASAEGIQRTAATGDPAYRRMLDAGVDASLRTAVSEFEDLRSRLDT